jgi:hypothetical protein
MKALLWLTGWVAVPLLQAQFVLPAVSAHRLGLNAVTRPTMMGGSVTPTILASYPGGLSTDPNPAAALGLFSPIFPQQPGSTGPASVGLANTAGITVGANGRLPAAANLTAAQRNPVTPPAPAASSSTPSATAVPVRVQVVQPRVRPPEPAEVSARILAHQQEEARKGSPSAQLALAHRYRKGDGVPVNPELSRVWLEGAARNGSEAAARELAEAARQ